MKKLISMLAVIGITTSATTSVIACDSTPKDNEVVKQDLTVDLWNEFTDGLVLSYNGPFVFEQGKPLENKEGTKNLFHYIIEETLFEQVNKKFNYNQLELGAMIPGNYFIISEDQIIGKMMEFDIKIKMRSKENSDQNIRTVKFRFTQTEQLIETQFLERVFATSFMVQKKINNQGLGGVPMGILDYQVYTEAPLESKSILEQKIEANEVSDFLAEHYAKTINRGNPDNSLFGNIKIEVKNFEFHDEIKFKSFFDGVDWEFNRYKVNCKISLKDNPNIFIEKSFYDFGWMD